MIIYLIVIIIIVVILYYFYSNKNKKNNKLYEKKIIKQFNLENENNIMYIMLHLLGHRYYNNLKIKNKYLKFNQYYILNMQVKEYKVSIIGEKEIGKTCFLRRLNNMFKETNNYIQTLGVEVTPIDLHGYFGKIRLNLWDNAGDERYRGLKDNYHINTDLAIIFKENNDNHLIYENELPSNTKKFYVNNYNINEPEYSVNEYKNSLYNSIFT